MEFPFDINPLFPERVTVLDHHLQPGRRTNASKATLEHQLAIVLDKMGESSAKAQLLSVSITSASRMQTNQHRLYLLKDGLANHGKGAAIGFLKVGHKKLFVLDGRGAHNEMEPLCVLDFYVHVSLQRHGYGKELFDYMIQYEGIKPHHLAVDRPSGKFLCFLKKHYGLATTIPQVNNFVVFDRFFWDRQCVPEDQELPWPFNQSPSLTRSNSLGCSPHRQPGRSLLGQQEVLRHVRVVHPQAMNGARETDGPTAQRSRTSTPEQQGMVAMGNMYSRYNKSSSQSPEQMAEKSRAAGSDQNSPGQTEQLDLGATDSPARGPDQLIRCVPPLDLESLPCDSPSQRSQAPLPSAGDCEPPPAPRPPEKPLPGERAWPEEAPLAKGQLSGGGNPPDAAPWLGKAGGGSAEGPPVEGGSGDSEEQDPDQRPRRDQATAWSSGSYGGKERGGGISWAELGVPINAQWIRHKQEFRNTRPW
uniref:alpha-tubulin N-acetyltransferase 1 isoform X2 n=1 Tax=Pristiophorus japonicus TaxID=55135 RepID=UPI00398F7EA1